MNTGMTSLTLAALVALAVTACNTAPPKQAGCPSGTVEKEGSCVPPEDSSGSGSSGSGSGGSSGSGSSGSGGGTAATSTGKSDPPPGNKVPYDKQMVDQKLARAAAQVKDHCGLATEEDGKRKGPWGKTTVTVIIDNNGRSRDTSIPAPYDGTAVGRCATNAFNGFQYPPFAGAADQKVDVEIEIVKPAGEK